MEILNLNLKERWFNMTLSGIKKEEYREIKPFWIKRLCNFNMPEEEKGENKIIPDNVFFDIQNHPWNEVFKNYWGEFKSFEVTRFMHGMQPNSPVFKIEHKGIRVGTGNPDWGAEPGKEYFIISHGSILETKNI
jgi:hypothetical protein